MENLCLNNIVVGKHERRQGYIVDYDIKIIIKWGVPDRSGSSTGSCERSNKTVFRRRGELFINQAIISVWTVGLF
jgi:hypothetical protein